MAVYSYRVSSDASIPNEPRLTFFLVPPNLTYLEAIATLESIKCVDVILDTGADRSLIILPLLQRVSTRTSGDAIKSESPGGGSFLGVPYPVGLIFDEIYMSDFEILGCAESDLSSTLSNQAA